MSKTKITMIKEKANGHFCLIPYGAAAVRDFESIRSDRPVIIRAHQARNTKHHDRIWSIYQVVADTDRIFETADQVNEWVKWQLGYVDFVLRSGSETVIKTKSISFESMDQIKFNTFYERAIKLLCERLSVDVEQLLEERDKAA